MSADRVMLLIDADNVSVDVMEQALRLLMNQHGGVHVRRAYCTPECAVANQAMFKRFGIKPMVNLAAGKNSTDIAMAVDAIDLVLAERPDVVAICSSDSDFAPLVQRLREKGCVVRGLGQKGKVADETQDVYDDYTVLEHRKPAMADAPAKRARKTAPRKGAAGKAGAARAASPAAGRPQAVRAVSGAQRAATEPPATMLAAAPAVEPIPAPLAPAVTAAPSAGAADADAEAPTPTPAADAATDAAAAPAKKAPAAKKTAAKKAASKTPAAKAPRKTAARKKAAPAANPTDAADAAAAPDAAAAGPEDAPEAPPAPPAPRQVPPPAVNDTGQRPGRVANGRATGPANVQANGNLKHGGNGTPRHTTAAQVLDCLPELAAGQSLALNAAVQRLREAQLLGKNSSSLKLFAQLAERFELTPAGKPTQVRLRR